MGRVMMAFLTSWMRKPGDLVWLRWAEEARPRTLPDAPRVSTEDLEGWQWANSSGMEVLRMGRRKVSVGLLQRGNEYSFDRTVLFVYSFPD